MSILNMTTDNSPISIWCDDFFNNIELYGHDFFKTLAKENFSDADWMSVLDEVFNNNIPKIAHNIKPVMRKLNDLNISHGNWLFDTALAAYILDAANGEISLENAVKAFGDAEVAFESNAHMVNFLFAKLQPLIESDNLNSLYYDIALPMCVVLADMEHVGVAIDRDALGAFGVKVDAKAAQIQQQIFEVVGHEFNINSPKQLANVLFEELKLPPSKKTKSGYSTDSEVLETLSATAPVAKMIVEYRQLTKLKSTYVDGLISEIASDGRIHSTFSMMTTATGRLSSSAPNLQNIPIRTPLGSELRKMFVAAPNNFFVDADYSQVELRVLAHISQDKNMIEAFKSGEDIHSITAQQLFGDCSSEMRRRAKAVNFGIVYGISSFALANDLGVSMDDAKLYMENYLERYSGVRDYMKNIVKEAKKTGCVTTISGRRRNIPELKSKIFKLRNFGERVALNTPIQGSAADIIFAAMIGVYQRLKRENLMARLILQIHDELLIETPANELEQVKIILAEEMEKAMQLDVPLTVDLGCGKNWLEVK